MIYESYKEIPFKLFISMLKDEKKVVEKGITEDEWREHKIRYDEENPTPKGEVRLSKQRKSLRSKVSLTKLKMLYLSVVPYVKDYASYFEAAKVRVKDNYKDSISFLELQIKKESDKRVMFDADLMQHLELEKNQKEVDGDVYDLLSGLGVIVGQRIDPQTALTGEVLAHQKTAERISKQKKNG